MTQQFNLFSEAVRKSRGQKAFRGILLALDPGETTGWCVWRCEPGEDDVMIACGQMPSWPIQECVKNFQVLLNQYQPTYVVYEQYRVYEWKTDSHSWSDVPTLRIIGSMETFFLLRNIPYSHQTPQVAKHFVSDDKLKGWHLYDKGQRHSRDAMRHATYFLCFGQAGHNNRQPS